MHETLEFERTLQWSDEWAELHTDKKKQTNTGKKPFISLSDFCNTHEIFCLNITAISFMAGKMLSKYYEVLMLQLHVCVYCMIYNL